MEMFNEFTAEQIVSEIQIGDFFDWNQKEVQIYEKGVLNLLKLFCKDDNFIKEVHRVFDLRFIDETYDW